MRLKSAHAVLLGMTVVVLMVVGLVFVWLRSAASPVTADAAFITPGATPSATRGGSSPTPVVVTSAPSPTPSPSKSSQPKPKPSPKPVPSPVQKPPPPPSEPGGCEPHYEGTNVPESQVEAALEAAAARRFWTVSQVTLPVDLIKAVAEQESGWQSAIVSCVGAVGAMQVLPATGQWMNQRFDVNYDVHQVQGNAMLGSAYLQWLIKYFADVYFDGQSGDYALRWEDCAQDPEMPDHREWCLLNAVISAYNVGHGTVERSATDDVPGYFVNHAYIENVRALTSRF